MKIKNKLVTFFLSKININNFADFLNKNKLLNPFYKIGAQLLIDKKFPHHLFIETTSFCNLRCKMCARNYSDLKLGSMNFALFKKIIDEAKAYKSRTFSLHLFGEPLLDRQIIEKINYIKEVNKKNIIILTTNGVLMTPERSERLINKIDKVVISLHGTSPVIYKQITGFDLLPKVEENVKKLIKIKKGQKANLPQIYLRLVRLKENFEEVNKFSQRWKNLPVILDIRDSHNFGGGIINELTKKMPTKRYPCYHLWFSPGINWDGEVSICCTDTNRQAIIGNVKNDSLSKIWQNDLINKYRQNHLANNYKDIPLCDKCDVWNTYPDIFFNWQKK